MERGSIFWAWKLSWSPISYNHIDFKFKEHRIQIYSTTILFVNFEKLIHTYVYSDSN